MKCGRTRCCGLVLPASSFEAGRKLKAEVDAVKAGGNATAEQLAFEQKRRDDFGANAARQYDKDLHGTSTAGGRSTARTGGCC